MVDKSPEYLMNKGGVYYFSKAVPQDLTDFYARTKYIIFMASLGELWIFLPDINK